MLPYSKMSNPYDDDTQRMAQVEARLDTRPPWRSALLVVGGCAAIALFGALAWAGLPGSGLILVPIGLGMILGGGIEWVLGHLGT
ncbi:MAG TPA: hypothetical protein VKV73_14580 [Chloroflexota bacterium]|nr:hypothetical protein [Chloroflexota bacterium]